MSVSEPTFVGNVNLRIPAVPAPSTAGMVSLNRKYLRVPDLQRLAHLLFTGRKLVEGLYSGKHTTRRRGQGVEFHDYREYLPGDDVGRVDWRVYGRTDRLYIRQYEHQSESTVTLLVDSSASMAYRGQVATSASKYDYACQLAAAIAFLTLKEHDRAALGFAREGLVDYQPPGGSMTHLASLLRSMELQRRWRTAGLPDALRSLTTVSGRRQILIVLSDFLDEGDGVIREMSAIAQRGAEVLAFQIFHPDELQLPDVESGVFVDSEGSGRLNINVPDIRVAYRKQVETFLQGWRASCQSRGIGQHLFNTGEPYFAALERFLRARTA